MHFNTSLFPTCLTMNVQLCTAHPTLTTFHYVHISSCPSCFGSSFSSLLPALLSSQLPPQRTKISLLPQPFCFFQRENKAFSKDSFYKMAGKTAFLHWHFGNIAQWFGTHLFLPPPSIFALWLLTFAALTSHSVLFHFNCLAARYGLVSLIYCI